MLTHFHIFIILLTIHFFTKGKSFAWDNERYKKEGDAYTSRYLKVSFGVFILCIVISWVMAYFLVEPINTILTD